MTTKNVIGVAAIFFVGAVIFSFLKEHERLKMELLLVNKQQSLLADQCRDYEYKLSSIRKYEDGYKDAMIKVSLPNAGTFNEGYEAAKLVYGTGSYTEGYHNAVAQFAGGCTNDVLKVKFQQQTEKEEKND